MRADPGSKGLRAAAPKPKQNLNTSAEPNATMHADSQDNRRAREEYLSRIRANGEQLLQVVETLLDAAEGPTRPKLVVDKTG